MSGCGNCSGNCEGCSGCSGCGGALTLHPGEVKLLEQLAQFPFLPVEPLHLNIMIKMVDLLE